MQYVYVFPLLNVSPVVTTFIIFCAVAILYGIYRLIIGLVPTS